jgi:hypothetical protein
MELRILHPDGRLTPGTVLPALSFPVSFESARQGMPVPAQASVDLRSVGVAVDKTVGTILLERFQPHQKTSLKTSYRVQHVLLLVFEPGTQTRLTRQDGQQWVFAVTPSGRLLVDEKGNWITLAPEQAPDDCPEVQPALDWEFHGQVDEASQTLCDVLARAPAGLPMRNPAPAHPTTAASLERCWGFLRAVPGADLSQMASVSRAWALLVDHWGSLLALLEEELPSGRAPLTQQRLVQVLASAG